MSETQLASMFIGSADDGDDIDRGRPSDVGNMIHILDGQTDVILDFITLDNIIDDTHKKSLEDTLETYDFIALADKRYATHLEKRNRIIIPDEDGTLREFVIFEAAKYRDTEGYKAQVFSHASYLELKKARILYPTRREGLTASQHAGWALNETGWRVGIVEAEGTRTFTIENHTNPYEFLKRIAREFDVELRFRVEHDGRRITARYVDFLERIGDWKGREVEFGKDLDSIRRVEKQDIVTALLGLGPEREDGTRLEVLVEDEEALQRWGRVDEHGNLHHLIEPYEIQSERTEMTEEEARRYTRTALDKRINTQVTYETTILDLEEVPGLEHEKIRFGDTIRIKDTYFNPPLYIEARVFEMERSIKNKAKKDIKLGDYVEYTEEEINAIWNQLRNEIRRRLDRMAIVTINSTAGNVFKNAQGETELTARTFVSGAERDEQGTLYDYQWMRFDKEGNHDTDFYAEGKTITVKASDIDEKATYRVLVAYELEVINTAEITISNVFDGEDGEPGPPGEQGPKGEDGQSVEDITIEYYLSDSDSTRIGGTWTETKPTYQPGKYLWIRQKITYKNPTAIEYTTPVLDDSWKAVEIADEAKQEAEEAKQEAQQAQTTADGKNSIFPQPTAPSTTGRKIGDVWFDTSRDNLMHRFDGTKWVEAKWGEQSIVANSITANHIKSLIGLNVNDQFIVDSNGNVKFSGRLEGASGTFGEVTAIDGDFFFQDTNSQTKYGIITKTNLITDPSFELAIPTGNQTPDGYYTSWESYTWNKVGTPRLFEGYVSDARFGIMFGYKYIGVNNSNYIRTSMSDITPIKLIAGKTYTFSSHFARYTGSPTPKLRVKLMQYNEQTDTTSTLQTWEQTFPAIANGSKIVRHSITFTLPSDFGTRNGYWQWVEFEILSGNSSWLHVDGVQLVENNYPTIYEEESSLWLILNGMEKASYFEARNLVIEERASVLSFNNPLWTGQAYPLDTQTIRPSKPLSDCMTGWILRWQHYVPGTGTENQQFQYTHIPKAHLQAGGRGMRIPLHGQGGTNVTKYIYVYDDRIQGYVYNGESPNNILALTGVFEY